MRGYCERRNILSKLDQVVNTIATTGDASAMPSHASAIALSVAAPGSRTGGVKGQQDERTGVRVLSVRLYVQISVPCE